MDGFFFLVMGHAPSSFFVRRSIECLVPDGLSWTQEQSLPVVRDMDIGYHFMFYVNFVFFRERHENRLLAQLIETCPTVY